MSRIAKQRQTWMGVFIVILVIAFSGGVTPVAAANEDQPQLENTQDTLGAHHLFLTEAMNKAFSVIESILKDPNLTETAKQRKILNFLRVVRYGPENKDYFSVIDLQGKMIVDPYLPELEGKDLSQFTDLNGQQMFKDILQTINDQGEGFINHQWPRYDQKNAVPKVTFVRQHTQFPWAVMTGVYLDTIEAYEIPFADLTIPLDPGSFTNDRKAVSPIVAAP